MSYSAAVEYHKEEPNIIHLKDSTEEKCDTKVVHPGARCEVSFKSATYFPPQAFQVTSKIPSCAKTEEGSVSQDYGFRRCVMSFICVFDDFLPGVFLLDFRKPVKCVFLELRLPVALVTVTLTST